MVGLLLGKARKFEFMEDYKFIKRKKERSEFWVDRLHFLFIVTLIILCFFLIIDFLTGCSVERKTTTKIERHGRR